MAPKKPPTTYVNALRALVRDVDPLQTVIVIVKPGCPHCAACVKTLMDKAIPHSAVPMSTIGGPALAAMSAALGGFSTYPRVFVRGQFHGGNDRVNGAIAAYRSR